MANMWDLDDMVTFSQIAELVGVGRAAVSNWAVRYETFPKPLLPIAKVYSLTQFCEWYDSHPWDARGRHRH